MKKAIIIGASSGIGYGLAVLYAQNGWLVGAVARRKKQLNELKELFPNNIITVSLDITGDSNTAVIEELIKSLGDLDLFIYCAGIASLTTSPNWNIDQPIIETNISAFTKCVGHVFNFFVAREQGQIAVISSIAAIRGGASAPVYNASKSFQSSFAESLNLQAACLGKKIIVSDIKPGYVNTFMAKGNPTCWMIPLHKACTQIMQAIQNKKRTVVITKRWRLLALMMKWIPGFLYMEATKKWLKK